MSNSGSGNQDNPQEAYSQLGIDSNATFEQVQQARDKKLSEAGDDLILKAKIESSYDSLLMDSLKARRSGKVSNDAFSASQKEEYGNNNDQIGFGKALLTRFGNTLSSTSKNGDSFSKSNFILPEGDGLTIRIAFGILAIVLLLVAPDANIQLILSLSTLGVFISQIKRGRRALQSLGWSVVFLATGYILGGLIVNNLGSIPHHGQSISINKLEALPAIILLWIASLLLS